MIALLSAIASEDQDDALLLGEETSDSSTVAVSAYPSTL